MPRFRLRYTQPNGPDEDGNPQDDSVFPIELNASTIEAAQEKVLEWHPQLVGALLVEELDEDDAVIRVLS